MAVGEPFTNAIENIRHEIFVLRLRRGGQLRDDGIAEIWSNLLSCFFSFHSLMYEWCNRVLLLANRTHADCKIRPDCEILRDANVQNYYETGKLITMCNIDNSYKFSFINFPPPATYYVFHNADVR